ncbi:uncharacterized protein EV422DRAFT_68393 [Fimicolochytrium jonesii]|uniref:uncharacterized protein n=1 Tax=Fimicolochytrium jonesii TaxID=1396493 RepID=UPI0022FE4BCC|nr:uncharacterized protein EV422DRAFT_68393 [Fimicolochytrium jonesii]KAI8820381.1 hypothetical protein EV422DRAFT_68393 [Fimicolochytrium jonesii]
MNLIAGQYGPPGMIVGAMWPLALTSILLAIWRVLNILDGRSAALFLSSLGSVATVCVMTWAKTLAPLDLLARENTYICVLIVLGQIQSGAVFVSASFRFSTVIMDKARKRKMVAASTAAAVLIVITTTTIGLLGQTRDGHHRVPLYFWFFNSITPGLYFVVGTSLFGRTLRKLDNTTKEHGANKTLLFLLYANNVCMIVGCLACLILIVLPLVRDTYEDLTVVPAIFLASAAVIFTENIFELITLFKRANQLASSVGGQAPPYEGGNQGPAREPGLPSGLGLQTASFTAASTTGIGGSFAGGGALGFGVSREIPPTVETGNPCRPQLQTGMQPAHSRIIHTHSHSPRCSTAMFTSSAGK